MDRSAVLWGEGFSSCGVERDPGDWLSPTTACASSRIALMYYHVVCVYSWFDVYEQRLTVARG